MTHGEGRPTLRAARHSPQPLARQEEPPLTPLLTSDPWVAPLPSNPRATPSPMGGLALETKQALKGLTDPRATPPPTGGLALETKQALKVMSEKERMVRGKFQ